jgi:LysR family hydrogen peroxide-inducible transcriptional activator
MPAVHDLSIRQLEYIVAVADTLGFHKAASLCHVSQPTLSAQVAQLEAVLGVKLFERDRRRVLVTASGSAVVAHARRVLVEVRDLLVRVGQLRDPLAATLQIGVIPTIAPYLLPDVVPEARERYPKLRLIFREEKTDAIVEHLRDGRLDAGLVALEADIGSWEVGRIATDPFVVALPKGHPLARKKRIHRDDLDGVDVLLLDDGHCFRSQALSICAQSGAREGEVRATSLATLVQMVSAGIGITLLPQIAVSVENRRGDLEVRSFAPPIPSRTIALIWRPQSPLTEAFAALTASFRGTLARRSGPQPRPVRESGRQT